MCSVALHIYMHAYITLNSPPSKIGQLTTVPPRLSIAAFAWNHPRQDHGDAKSWYMTTRKGAPGAAEEKDIVEIK